MQLKTQNFKQKTVHTIYFWWGTPSVLSIEELEEILTCFPFLPTFKGSQRGYPSQPPLPDEEPELTIECNPEDITEDYVTWILELGFNRISLGVQSLNDATLKAISRSNRESIFQALEFIKKSLKYHRWEHEDGETEGSKLSENDERKNQKSEANVPQGYFQCDKVAKGQFFDPSGAFDTFQSWKVYSVTQQRISVNIDLIIGLPFSKPGDTLRNIQELHSIFPFITHTSVYLLEEGLYPKDWKEDSMDEEAMQQEYLAILDYFETLGWHHYEISNWAKPGYESRHNQWYWNHTPTRAFGLSGASYEDEKRWENSASFSGYYRWDRIQEEILTRNELHIEQIMFGIRTFSLDSSLLEPSKYLPLIARWLLKKENSKLICTSTWIFQENSIITELI